VDFAVFDLTQGVTGRSHREVYQHIIEQAIMAEEGGLDAYYITEHHFEPGYSVVGAPNVVVGALSQRTQRIRLGVMTTVLPYHHPVRVAEEIRELDLLTDGRLDVAYGRGAIRREQQGWGVPRSDSAEMFETAYHLVRRFLTEPEVESYESRWWSGGRVVIVPEPTQLPLPPMWLTAVSETSSYKAGRLGLHCCTAFRDVEEVVESIANYRAGWEEWAEVNPDTSPGKYGGLYHVFVAETLKEAQELAQPHIEGWLDHFVKILSDRPVDKEEPSYETHRRVNEKLLKSNFQQLIEDGRLIFGTPDQCVQQLEHIASSGINLIQGYFQFGELDYAASNRSLQLFCDEVLPKVRHLNTPVPVGG
jgi:alkanesulfonate monooxygenase SsuD/methylene tetrahydromethanopterin reductase-like flavin-dependent oxidoreductase (luciferase family)